MRPLVIMGHIFGVVVGMERKREKPSFLCYNESMYDWNIRNIFKIFFPQTRLNRSLRILITTNTGIVFIVGLFAPFYAVFIQNIGGNIAFAGFSWALFAIVQGSLILLFSNWELRVKEQELLIALSYIVRGVVFLSYAFMQSIPQLLVTQIFWGIAGALGTPAFDAVYSAHTTQEDSIVQWGGWEGVAAIATGVAALLGGLLIQSFGYSTVFLGMAAFSIILGLYIWSLPREVL